MKPNLILCPEKHRWVSPFRICYSCSYFSVDLGCCRIECPECQGYGNIPMASCFQPDIVCPKCQGDGFIAGQ